MLRYPAQRVFSAVRCCEAGWALVLVAGQPGRMFGEGDWEGLTARHPALRRLWSFPMLVAAVDPAAEAKLDGLNEALTSGHLSDRTRGPRVRGVAGGLTSTFPPVLAADTSGLGEYASVQVQRLPSPEPSPPVLDPAAMDKDTNPGTGPDGREANGFITAGQAYAQMLSLLTPPARLTRTSTITPFRVLERRPDHLPSWPEREPWWPDRCATPGIDLVGSRAPGLTGPPMDESATAPTWLFASTRTRTPARCAGHPPGTACRRGVRPGQGQGVRSAVRGSARPVPADRRRARQCRPAGTCWAATTCCPASTWAGTSVSRCSSITTLSALPALREQRSIQGATCTPATRSA